LHRFAERFENPESFRKIAIAFEEAGYQRLNNPHEDRGRWRFPDGRRVSVYRRKDLTDREGFAALENEGGR
jgi:hypothetical protein